jgi:phosphoheptose isomerase
MPYPQLDRHQLRVKPLRERHNKVDIARDHVSADAAPANRSAFENEVFRDTVERVRQARANGRPVIVAFGAHTIKNGLGPVLIRLMEEGWVTHLATNGAGIIHDWEFAYLGQSSEDVRANVDAGQFGIWQESGYYINLAIVVGAYRGMGYGEAVGAMIQEESLTIPTREELQDVIKENLTSDPARSASAADLLQTIATFDLAPGKMPIPHPCKQYSVQGNAYRLGIPFTGHPMIGHDIIYNHPMNCGAAIGRTAERDFLSFAHQVRQLDGGVYLSIGSAVMSPMIFEKSLSMSQNLEMQEGRHIDQHYMLIVDLAESTWDWSRDGEPPMDNPAYYLRYCKTFNRMGGTMHYMCADNREFLTALREALEEDTCIPSAPAAEPARQACANENPVEHLIERHPSLAVCREHLTNAIDAIENSFRQGGKLLLCGNGGSQTDCEHIAGELLKSFRRKRPVTADWAGELPEDLRVQLEGGLPALVLQTGGAFASAFANDVNADAVYAQQVHVLGGPKDILLAISTSGNSANVLAAARTARAKGLTVIGLTGRDGGALAQLADLCLCAPADETYQVQELHLPLYHTLCLALEDRFFPPEQ